MMNLTKIGFDTIYLPATFTVCARWAPTKPRWVPTAKTKKFRVIPRPQEILPGETSEINRLYNIYNSHLKGSLALLKTMYRESEVSQDVIDAQTQEKERFWQQSLDTNNEWNRLVGEEREQLDRELFKEDVRKVKERISQLDEEKRKERERIDGIVQEQQELSKNFISRDKLDEHVEKILNSKPHSFNFAIDLQGNVYDDVSRIPTRKVTEDGKLLSVIEEKNTRRGLI